MASKNPGICRATITYAANRTSATESMITMVNNNFMPAERFFLTSTTSPDGSSTVSSATSASAANLDYSEGERVRHKKFGDGTIIKVQKFEKDAMLEIAFDSGETKRLMAAFAKLEKI